MNINTLFPTAVCNFDLGRNLTTAEVNFIQNQNTRDNVYNKISISSSVLNCIELLDLKTFCEDCINEYKNTILRPKTDFKVQITQSWINYSAKGQQHHKHNHYNSFLSGVFYIKTDPLLDKIMFYKHEAFNPFAYDLSDFNLYNSKSWWLESKPLNLYIFPSDLQHSVNTVETEERISLSFNTFPVGKLGNEDSLTALTIANIE
jgi:uncharacterized protein (TIGR02466 family)